MKTALSTITTDSFQRFQRTWANQSSDRAQRIQGLLLNEVNRMRNVTKDESHRDCHAIEDPFRDTLDDLDELDANYDDGFSHLDTTVS